MKIATDFGGPVMMHVAHEIRSLFPLVRLSNIEILDPSFQIWLNQLHKQGVRRRSSGSLAMGLEALLVSSKKTSDSKMAVIGV